MDLFNQVLKDRCYPLHGMTRKVKSGFNSLVFFLHCKKDFTLETSNMAWYKKSFGKDYLKIYSHRTREEAKRHVDFACKALNLRAGQLVLDLGCGAGRHSYELIEKNLRVAAFDLSAELLSSVRDSEVSFYRVRGDMRYLPFTADFDAVLSFFTSFGYFDADEENEQVVKAVSLALKPGGLFFLDFFNLQYTLSTLIPEDRCQRDGIKLIQERRFDADSFRVEKITTISDARSHRQYRESVRAYGIIEIGHFLAEANMKCIAVYGDYDGRAFSPDSPRLIVIGRKGV